MSSSPRRSGPTFQPRFTIGLVYVFAFFFLYCLLLAAPTLWEVAKTVPPGPEQQEIAKRATQEVVQPRLWIALAGAIATAVFGAHTGLLPGLRRRD